VDLGELLETDRVALVVIFLGGRANQRGVGSGYVKKLSQHITVLALVIAAF
jgi:hypothetical protein